MKWTAGFLVGCLFGAATANVLPKHRSLFRPPPPPEGEVAASSLKARSTGTGVFEQLIDHDDPSLGTFSQRYWWSDEFWAGPGSPVVFFTPGEGAADGYEGYLTNRTITGLFAQAIQGAVVMLEHRYWGESSPFDDLTVENLQYLTLPQSIKDTTYFANNVVFPFDTNGSSQASRAPWVFSGGSYSGALSGWVQAVDPGTFWAYHASSAVVEAVSDFWQYFVPVQAGMPANCSADVSLVIDNIDDVLINGSDAEKQALKARFGPLAALQHDDDFASALENGPWLWQSNQFYTGYSSFYQFCDYVENAVPFANSTVTPPSSSGVGLEKALNGYAAWMRDILVPGYCAGYGYDEWTADDDVGCFDTYDASSPIFTDRTLANAANRQWNWFLCNEPFDFWQDGAPASTGRPSIVSRLVTPEYWERQCALFFPPEGEWTYGHAEGKTVDDVNAYTGGWSRTNTTRLVWANGEFDPWKDATVSSDFRPEGPLESTAEAPVFVIPDGIHCSDLLARNGEANAGVQKVIDSEIAQVVTWVAEYYK
ncbi:putative extracellular serine carboxypeptidase [Lasiodiplodia hormozganensis]|uniref:Extracellular serine carboxypeptidase n=1 Tax=Lasiodiplodia hormozganensis TaxID=869390 RepID=A0AA40CQF6_9PEZI|nr:putative extracellular serine carboxypeptidase [Lasiodiplodia hormozganensis]